MLYSQLGFSFPLLRLPFKLKVASHTLNAELVITLYGHWKNYLRRDDLVTATWPHLPKKKGAENEEVCFG